jgi:hypothetical protein
MLNRESELQRQRVRAWHNAHVELSALRRKEIREGNDADIRAVVPTIDLLRRLGVEPSAETGLVQQQAWFAKLRHA